ncbi:MFS transporter [Streptomyces sp. WAC 06725]|uniref:MFS transporter n=1 Tax=Streptomyces sp. WAC 06725 TaxID=2203209 RepID=UPI000F73D5D7|nr:MFS transporter [Streptomyces sp. WAC 06725]RSO16314.1 MFS transporter [Streptomyces sp. WAC 06725]
MTAPNAETTDDRRTPGHVPRLMNASVMAIQAMVAGVNLAVPSLSASGLHPSSTQLVWIVDVYVLVFAALLIPAGALGDRLGRRRVLIGGLAVFAAGSLGCALAPDVATLLVFRAVSGLGAAMVMPATLALTLAVTPPAGRGRAVGAWSGATGLGALLGNLVAGSTLQFFSWPVFFAVFVPAAALLAVLAAVHVPADGVRVPVDAASVPFDTTSAALLAAPVVALLFGLIEGRELGWASVPVLAAFAVALALGALFVRHALRSAAPLVDPRLFKLPAVRAGTLGVAVAFLGMFSLFYLNAQYLQYVKGFGALATGLAILPQALCVKLVSPRAAALGERWGTRRVVVLGMGLIVLGLVLLSLSTADTPYWRYLIGLLTMATGMGLATPPLSGGIMNALPRSRGGLGSGLNSTAREIGSAIGVAVTGTVLTARFTADLPAAVAERAHSASDALAAAGRLGAAEHASAVTAFTDAMAVGYRTVAVVVAVGAVPVLIWRGRRNQRASRTSWADKTP